MILSALAFGGISWYFIPGYGIPSVGNNPCRCYCSHCFENNLCLPAFNVNGISAADLIVEALGQLSVSAAIESVLGGRFNGNDSGTIESAGIESLVSGICECYRRIIRERTTSRRARMA